MHKVTYGPFCQLFLIFRSDFCGLDPTGKRFQMHCAFLFFFADGNIEREVRLHDFTGILVQLGVLKAKTAF